MSDTPPVIVWFRNDLRLDDNPALAAAAATGRPVLPVYLLDDTNGGAARWWLHHSLASLARSLAEAGAPLLLQRGDPAKLVPELASTIGADSVFWNRRYDARSLRMDTALKTTLTDAGIDVASANGSLLHEPWEIRTGVGGPFQTFTPFWRVARGASPADPLPPTRTLRPVAKPPKGDDLTDWGLLPTKPDWAGGLRAAWQPGEAAALDRLASFLDEDLPAYRDDRDRPDRDATSRLSPYLRWGEISPRRIWQTVMHRLDSHGGDAAAEKFLAELGWREFSYHLLFHHPTLPTRPLRQEFENFPWQRDAKLLRAWQQGRTGYAIVDAGMRQLWHIGWMHNRVRMIVASFLVKHLLQPWQDGAAWFLDTLVDADLASNSASWQWVAGCGADAAPYFRIFNPELQAEKFDPSGAYVKRWLPDGERSAPVVDLSAGRRRALNAYAQMRESATPTD
jgi:deoxyribodipyrimidine photo-lyase